MKRFVLLLALSAACGAAVAADAGVVNGGLPPGFPPTIRVLNVPLGSGIPSVGATSGYSVAEHVRDGLYHVPGYLPFDPTAEPVPARVVPLRCTGSPGSEWVCDGYSIHPGISRGENILIQPVLSK